MPRLSNILGTTYQGSVGPQGNAATVDIDTTVLNTNQSPFVINTGNNLNAVLSFGLPKSANVFVGDVVASEEGSQPVIERTFFSNGDVIFNFTLPRGNTAGYDHANSAFDTANIAINTANSAYLHANGSYAHANGTSVRSNSAYLHTNASFNLANTAKSIADNVNNYFANSSIFLPIYRNSAFINVNYSTTADYNEMSVGPITIANNVTVTVTANSVWKII
jgi:hypothetical protein